MKTLRLVLLMCCLALLPLVRALAADVYESDPDHTFAFFEFNHIGYSFQRDRFDKVNATVKLDMAQRVGRVEVSIDVNSISTGSFFFNQMLQSEGFFDAKQFPLISFVSERLSFDRLDNVTSVEGELTIKGITKPLTLKVSHFKCMMHPVLHKPACGLNATGTIRRSDFALGKYVPLIGDEVSLYVVMEALKR
ncbi:Polyisoprenoid-binding protein YceI [Polaromonas sp. OV174]|uniref:YceI family protein n=1 Tax=Polaromonas sp. OV174 TaxID=1855300 RepID=UPI0008F3B0E0|nr:YceI family protein [Polaromonas sp. OV174]SFB85622.1 Polyisoprenoid-binding protein YceI [Polaromonas sp. OV174]